MFIDDPNVVEYAKSQGRFHATELRASKAYFLLSVTRVQVLEKGEVVPTFPDSLKNEIARYAIRNSNARSMGVSSSDCDLSPEDVTISAAPTTRRVLYDVSDPTARDLADRIIALATTTSTVVTVLWAAVPGLNSASPRPAAVGVSATELVASLASGSDFAYVVALPLGRPESCFLPRELLRQAPWLGAGRAPFHLKAIPLVTTGPCAVATRSGSGVSFGLNMNVVGNILIVGTSRTEAP